MVVFLLVSGEMSFFSGSWEEVKTKVILAAVLQLSLSGPLRTSFQSL